MGQIVHLIEHDSLTHFLTDSVTDSACSCCWAAIVVHVFHRAPVWKCFMLPIALVFCGCDCDTGSIGSIGIAIVQHLAKDTSCHSKLLQV